MIPGSCRSSGRKGCGWTSPSREPHPVPASALRELARLTLRTKAHCIIQHDMTHSLNIFLGRIRDNGGPLSISLFLLLNGEPSRVRPEPISLPTRQLEAKQNH